MIAPGIAASDFKDGPYWINKTGRYTVTRTNFLAIAVDNSQNTYSLATISNKVSLIKYDNNGVLVWQILLGSGTNPHFGNGISVDSDGNILVTGRFSTTTSTTPSEIFTAKVDPDGNVLWNKRFNTTASSINTVGSVVYGFGGAAPASITVGSGGGAIRIINHDGSGNISWQRSLSSPSQNDTVSDISVDSNGDVYICGRYNTGTKYQTYIVKIDGSGSILWQKILSDSATSTLAALSDPKMDINLANDEIFIGYHGSFTYPIQPSGTQTMYNFSIFKIAQDGTILNQSIGYTGYLSIGQTRLTGLRVSNSETPNVYLSLQGANTTNIMYFRLDDSLISNSAFQMPAFRELRTTTLDIDIFDNVYFGGDYDLSTNATAIISVNGKLPSELGSRIGSYIIDYQGSDAKPNITLDANTAFFAVPDVPSRYAAQFTNSNMTMSTTTFGSLDSSMTVAPSTYSFTQRSFE